MPDWLLLLRNRRFRGFWLALLCGELGEWCLIASLPILVAQRFGAGMELVLSLGLRVLPKLVLAPFASRLLTRFGAARTASVAMAVMGILTAVLPFCRTLPILQVLIALIGTLDLFVLPGLFTLRASVTPAGLEMSGNTLCSIADRGAKVAGPVLGGLATVGGLVPAFTGFGALLLLSAIPIARLPDVRGTRDGPGLTLRGYVRLITTDRQIAGLLISVNAYLILIGGLRPFLFWANRDWFGGSDTAWTGLLAAQGAGALIGAVAAALLGQRLTRAISPYRLMLLAGLAEGLSFFLLLLVHTPAQAMLVLGLAGIPEVVSAAAWFTAAQMRVPADRLGAFYTLSAPLWDVFITIGIASAGLYAGGVLSLSAYWAMLAVIATAPILPLMIVRDRT